MNDRMLQWVGIGVLAAGLSTAMLIGAGIAVAETGSGSGDGQSTSSESTGGEAGDAGGAGPSRSLESTADQENSDTSDAGADADLADVATGFQDGEGGGDRDVTDNEGDVTDDEITDGEVAEEEAAGEELADDGGAAEGDVADDDTQPRPNRDATTTHTGTDNLVTNPATDNSGAAAVNELGGDATPAVRETEQPDDTREADATAEGAVPTEPSPTVAGTIDTDTIDTATVDTATVDTATVDTDTAGTAVLAMSAPVVEETAPARPSLIHVIGTLAWSIFDFVSKIAEGPAVIPAGSNVTVGRSRLHIDCGDGYTADADWYFPTETETPTKLIYLQHGGFARAGNYNVTAAELAERNNAIVVAPSITSNYFACDGCALGGDPMHAAVAKLFLDDREALLASAQAAGYAGTELPQRFVISGHSAGGQLAGGAAGYYSQFSPAEEVDNLAGVLLLDTSPVGGAVERGIAKVPVDIPVHIISAAPGVMNTYGGVDKVVSDLRPGQFVGVQLVGGVHADAWQSTNALAGFVVGLGTGFPAPQNVEAVQVLAQGWINDWYTPEDPDTGFYGDLGSVIDIPTDAGTAEAYVLPAPERQLNFVELLIKALFESAALLTALQTCAVDPSASGTTGAEVLAENSTPNTALSLDGRAQTGQSVGQHVCTD